MRRAESLTTLRVQCRAPNSLADSDIRRFVSDRRTRTYPRVAKPLYTLPTARPAPPALSVAVLAAMSISLPTHKKFHYLSTDHKASI